MKLTLHAQAHDSDDEEYHTANRSRSDDSRPSRSARASSMTGGSSSSSSSRNRNRTDRSKAKSSSSSSSSSKNRKRSKSKRSNSNQQPIPRYPEWMGWFKHQPNCYFPQLGDRIVYIKQAHQLYVQEYPNPASSLIPITRPYAYGIILGTYMSLLPR